MQLFYVSSSELTAGHLSPEESNHCVRVLRKKEDDEIHLIDGKGGSYSAVVTKANAKSCEFKVTETKQSANNLPDLHVLIAPTKSLDRFEFFIEKACELGIKEITPVFTFNSERRHLNRDKLTKKMVAACKQSYTLHFPVINEPIKFAQAMNLHGSHQAMQKLIAHCYSHETPHLKTMDTQKATLLLIGPEGDFSKEEVTAAEQAGFKAVSLGDKRLRTETAGIFACSIFNLVEFNK